MATDVHTTAPPAQHAGSTSALGASTDASEAAHTGASVYMDRTNRQDDVQAQDASVDVEKQGGRQPAHKDSEAAAAGYNNDFARASGAVVSSTLAERQDASSSTNHSDAAASTSSKHDDKARRRRDRDDEVPACLLRLRDGAEACNHRAQAWAAAQDEKAMQKQQQRRERSDGGVKVDEDTGEVIEPKGDPLLQRKGMVVPVALILAWVYIVFTWRICVRGIRRDPGAITTRTEGIGLLVGFHVIWLLAIWSYIKVFTTPPGYVRDHVPITDPPRSPTRADSEDEISEQQVAQEQTGGAEGSGTLANSSEEISEHKEQQSLFDALNVPEDDAADQEEATEGLDTTTPAIIGPLGAAKLAQQDEAKRIEQETGNQFEAENDGAASGPLARLRVPVRQPPSGLPLHPSNNYCYRCRRVKPPRAHHCRHCGTCVLAMDHHCPWTTSCVGAQNHMWYFLFIQWVTVLEVFVLIANAILFARGIERRRNGVGSAGWPIDGYMISLFPITAMFTLFTSLLYGMHVYLMVMNLTTIEHLLFERFKTRERIDIDHYLKDRSEALGQPKLEWTKQLKEAKKIRQGFAQYWGSLKTETNQWWLDGRRRGPIVGIHGLTVDAAESDVNDEDLMATVPWYRAAYANWCESMGDNPFGWILPIGRARNANGLEYESNWRFGEFGQWTPREQWPQRWRELQAQATKRE